MSVTYPNVLVMGYLEETGQLTPEWRMKLEAAINAGYQRILTFETRGGGFGWYGRSPANTRLTAYGILGLVDMNKVYPIDTRVIDRARNLLAARQKSDGSWDGGMGATAYIVWALKEAGYPDARAEAWLRAQPEPEDPYVKALAALALGDKALLDALEHDAQVEGDAARWMPRREGIYGARGEVASIEATALAAMALLRDNRSMLADKALTAIARAKDPNGSWGSTQSTILCIKALLEASTAARPTEGDVAVRLAVNGREIPNALRPLSKETFDVVQQVEIPIEEGDNDVELSLSGEARVSYQVFGRYYLPWNLAPERKESPLQIATRFDKSELTLRDRLKAITTLRYNGPGTFMVIVDLGIPPGFTPEASSFEALVKKGMIDRYTFTGRQITLYLGRVERGRRYEIEYELTPRFPIDASAPGSGAYEYYTPENETQARPQRLRVTE